MNPFQSLRDYEEFVYTLKQRFSSVHKSTLVVVQRGKRTATLQGEVTFASTYPHHKHIHPDVRHHRIPAPNMSFTQPNLPTLIREIEKLLEEPNS